MTEFSQAQVTLTLALLASRSVWDPKKKNHKRKAKSIRRGLAELAPLKDDCTLVWGPGTYRFLGSAFDSSMMYVVRHKRHKARYSVVVRGTNPLDMLDWLLGDFLAHRQVPWHSGERDVAPGAKVSLSTALGLKILLNMRAKAHTESIEGLHGLEKFGYLAALDSADDAAERAMADSGPGNTNAADPIAKAAKKLVKKLLKYQQLWNLPAMVSSSMAATLTDLLRVEDVARMLKLRKRLIRLLDKTMTSVVDTPTSILMPGHDELSNKQSAGSGLLELLGALAEKHGEELELVVTGHSKGAALATALALFLSDTQRNEDVPIRRHYQWNPGHRANIACYAFAGPTPGNTDFANYFNQHLGASFYRYSNTLDIVTLAWQSDALRTAASVYGDTISGPAGVELIFKEMAAEVETLDYCHTGQNYPAENHVIEFTGPMKKTLPSYLAQVIYQHVDAYLVFLELDKVMNLPELLGLKTLK